MKKIFFAILCSAAVISCAKEVVINADKEAITFESAFVDKATKAAYDGSYNNSNLSEFQVYATITGTGSNEGTANIFGGERVVKGNSLGQGVNWSYATANTQYWIPGNDYQFRAIAEGNVAGVTEVAANAYGMATAIHLLDASAQKDILVAEHTVTNYTKPQSGTPAPVAFTFDHILSKAKFTVKNTITTDNGYSYKVYNLSVNGVAKNGVYTFGAGWSEAATRQNYDLIFGHAVATGTEAGVAEPTNIPYNGSMESNYDRLLVPTVAEDLNVTFTYELLKDDVLIDTQDKSLNTGALTLVSGSSYNFVISLGNPGDPIQFDVEKVNDWDERAPIIIEPIEVATAQELAAAIKNGENVILTQNIELTGTEMLVAADKNVIADLNGKTITVKALDPIKNLGTMALKNGKVVADNSENTRRCVYNYGTMIIEDVGFVQTYNKKGAAINNEGKMTLNNVTVDAVYYSVWAKGADVETVINGGSFTTTNVIGLEGGHAYAILTSGGAKLTVNNAEVTGNHGVVCVYDEGSVATINSGKFTLASPSFTPDGNSSWVFYASLKGEVKYNEAACELVVPASKTNGVNTTENEGKITKF